MGSGMAVQLATDVFDVMDLMACLQAQNQDTTSFFFFFFGGGLKKNGLCGLNLFIKTHFVIKRRLLGGGRWLHRPGFWPAYLLLCWEQTGRDVRFYAFTGFEV